VRKSRSFSFDKRNFKYNRAISQKTIPLHTNKPKTNYLPQISFATEMNCSVRRSRSFSTSSLQVDMSNDVF
jgi:hypothetical protein